MFNECRSFHVKNIKKHQALNDETNITTDVFQFHKKLLIKMRVKLRNIKLNVDFRQDYQIFLVLEFVSGIVYHTVAFSINANVS
jgi:hypothetical protein